MRTEHGGDWAGYQEEYGSLPMDFSASISPLGLPKGVREAAVRALDEADRYPDPLCRALCAKLAEKHGIPAGQIVCGNGAADLIHRLCSRLRPRHALLAAPDFTEYRRALQSAGCGISLFPLQAEDGFRLGTAFADTIGEETDIVFLSNPNNPSGVLTGREVLEPILQRCREKNCLLVVDECFLDFAEREAEVSMIPALDGTPQLAVLKAFTKTYAMAGLRLGYLLCGNAELAAALQREGQPWPVSHIAQEAGLAALTEENYVNLLRRLITTERKRMAQALDEMGFTVIPGEANYLLLQSGNTRLCDRLRRRGILIRDCSCYDGLGPGWYRVAVRTERENSALLGALREVL
ncbi:MAG: aminotransferase class I/II-fold pyridoxal phosphate-dependent enzyme [Oscillospiraceae bacterium]|nr:aminotransferase class I/II-fold pyridoxal phosphate-dependent enzyme [Oscillospiraceae bacterium]